MDSTIRNSYDVKLGLTIDQLLDNVVEDVIDMLLGVPVARDCVLDGIEAIRVLNSTLVRKRKPGCLCNRLLAPTPPSQLSQIREDDTWRLDIAWAGHLSLDVLDEIDGRTLINPSLASNDTMCEDTEVLCMFVEEDDHSLLVLDVLGDEDGDIGFGFLCAKGKSNLLEAKVLKTLSNEFADSA